MRLTRITQIVPTLNAAVACCRLYGSSLQDADQKATEASNRRLGATIQVEAIINIATAKP